ncbi:MAG: preprotein translocase subunit YajC [Burkholderiales bacterium]|nr:preprotein translocase subunit YajC [Burkholderiales bacterium]
MDIFSSPLIMIGIMIVMFFLMIRPQQKQAKERKLMIDALNKGDEIVTAAGILGKINKITDTYVILEISNGTEMIVQKSAINMLLPKGTIKSI